MARHDTILRLLIRRYVTAEQRKRDEFGITEDDVREIRQDISTFRYDLIDILRKNGMHTPTLDKEDTNSQYIHIHHINQTQRNPAYIHGKISILIYNYNEYYLAKFIFEYIIKFLFQLT